MVSSSLIISPALLALASLTLASAVPHPGTGGAPNAQQCGQAQALAVGINRNIAVQQQELAGAQDLANQLNGNVDQARYTATKNALLGVISNGMSIRQTNQQMAPPGNAAIPGLAAVAKAQQAEQDLANSLKGNPGDKAMVQKLITDFTGGIAKNQENAAKAVQGC